MSKITARIRQAESDKGTDALWLLVERTTEDSTAHAVRKDELVAIREAIDEYLNKVGITKTK